MKTLKYITTVAIAVLCSYNLHAQNKKQQKEAAVKSMVESKNFDFVAQYANPLGGRQRYLDFGYDVRIKPDSVISYLPYFGQITFDPPIYPTDDGIKFTSTRYGYQTITNKRGSYIITITPTDAKYIQKLIFTISSEGYTTLQVTITNRYAISYDGYITENKNADKVASAQQSAKNH